MRRRLTRPLLSGRVLKSTLRVFRSQFGRNANSTALALQSAPRFCRGILPNRPAPAKKKIQARFGDRRQLQFLLIEPQKRCRRQIEGRGTRSPRRLGVPRGKLRPHKWYRVPCSTSPRQLQARAWMRSWGMCLRLCGRCRTARTHSLPVDLRRARP